MDAAVRRLVRDRAGERCEYCRLPEKYCQLLHRIGHIIARKHGGRESMAETMGRKISHPPAIAAIRAKGQTY
jgi:hypothetical protein